MRTTPPLKTLSSLFLIVGAAACGPKLSMEGKHVQVAETAQAPLCRPIGNVEGEAKTHEKAETILRNRAGEIKANTVVITEHAMTPGLVKLVGQAYSCSVSNAPVAPVVVPEVPAQGATVPQAVAP